jgi:Fe-S oxidoreductase/nitrate reductase gamma subunit
MRPLRTAAGFERANKKKLTLMVGDTLALWLLLLAAVLVAGWRFWSLLRPLITAPSDSRSDHVRDRIVGLVTNVGLHRRLLKFRYSGVLHLMIFSGFAVLLTAIVQSFGSGLFPGFSLAPIGGQTWIALLQDIFALVALTGIGLAVWQRYVRQPARFKGSSGKDALIIYCLVIAVVAAMLLEFSCSILVGNDPSALWRPVSSLLAMGLAHLGVTPDCAAKGEALFYWIHIAAILTFLAYIPGSKHRHIFTAIPNIYFRNIEPKGLLPAPPPGRGQVGVGDIKQFSWKHMLDLYSCTECGRCQSVCPATAAGQPLSPKLLIMNLRDHLMDVSSGEDTGPLIGGAIQEATLWACTTCRACMDVCPLHIEHVPKIVDMRRQLVEQGSVPRTLQDAFSAIQRSGNSMGRPPRQRPKWTKKLSFSIKDARKEGVDILWFVGDYASYDPRVERITVKVAEILHSAGVDFGILFEAEQNSGNDVRRAGEEGLFETLARSNIEAIDGCDYRIIMTTDPHSLNALRNEYAAFGRSYAVQHYTEVIDRLIESAKIRVKADDGGVVAYHDPCYLGRYNGGFDAPRRIIARAGYHLHEMGRIRENSFCCGAGGGRIWIDDADVIERPSENRIKEALALGDATRFVVACPKDMVMYSAAVQALGVQDRIKVCDIVDLIELAEPLTR